MVRSNQNSPADAPDLPKRAEKLRKEWLGTSAETRAKVSIYNLAQLFNSEPYLFFYIH